MGRENGMTVVWGGFSEREKDNTGEESTGEEKVLPTTLSRVN